MCENHVYENHGGSCDEKRREGELAKGESIEKLRRRESAVKIMISAKCSKITRMDSIKTGETDKRRRADDCAFSIYSSKMHRPSRGVLSSVHRRFDSSRIIYRPMAVIERASYQAYHPIHSAVFDRL